MEHAHQPEAVFVEQSPPSGPLGAEPCLNFCWGSGQQMTDMQLANFVGMCFSYLSMAFPATPVLGGCSVSASVYFNTSTDRGVSSSCAHSCNNVISALSYHLLFLW